MKPKTRARKKLLDNSINVATTSGFVKGSSVKLNASKSLDSTSTDVIDTSVVHDVDARFDFIRTPKSHMKKPIAVDLVPVRNLDDAQDVCLLNTPLEQLNIQDEEENDHGFINRGNCSIRSKSFRSDLRRSILAINSPGLENSPPARNIAKEFHPAMKSIISSVTKKSPTTQFLTKSKLRNIENWLLENNVSIVETPPFSNLSMTPTISKKIAPVTPVSRKIKENDLDSVDPEVERVLVAIYGDDWRKHNNKRCKTEPKQRPPKIQTGAKSVKSKTVRKEAPTARRNIFEVQVPKPAPSTLSPCSSFTGFSPSVSPNVETPKPPRGKNIGMITPKSRVTPSQARSCAKTPKRTFLASLSVSTPTSYCHPEAQEFKINFKSKKEDLCKRLFKLYNTEVFEGGLPEDFSITWNTKLRGTAGYCRNKRVTKSTGEVLRVARVELATKIIDRADRLRDTLIHELCHAACWVISGKLDGHGPVWMSWAGKARARFPELPTIKRCHNYEIAAKFTYRCTGCGCSINRHSKSIDVLRKRCGYCYGTLELLVNKKRKGKTEVPEFDLTRTVRPPNTFALFVKDHYQIIKGRMPQAKHAEIMKAISQEYALVKNKTKPSQEGG